MKRVDYDLVAPGYARRYETNRYDGTQACLEEFLRGAEDGAVAEVGCGTGHWLAWALATTKPAFVAGLDLSKGMLDRARVEAPSARLVRGTADRLPWADASFDRVFCINALHHFQEWQTVFAECARVLRGSGAFLTIGLDPHEGTDTWWVYDYFPGALDANLARFPPTALIRDGLRAAGFRNTETTIAEHLPAEMSFEDATANGLIDRRSTSQLMVITDEQYAIGLARLNAERPVLRADLRLYATIAWR